MKEPKTFYSKSPGKIIRVFTSFEEENEFTAKQRAMLSYDERMSGMEVLRRMVFSEFLGRDGSWIPIAKIFKIMKPYTNETGGQL